MTPTVHLEASQIPSHLRGNYTGKQYKAVICESVHIPIDAGLWSGGSRDQYKAVNLATGQEIPLPGQDVSPWNSERKERQVALAADFAIVRHTIFCGKDMGLTFYLLPQNAAAMLPPVEELTDHERIVLVATRQYKSSYNGQDRYQLAMPRYNPEAMARYPSREQWEAAKQALINRGFLNKAGAITTKGRNAAQ